MKETKFDYGMIGLGTMGRNLVYNMSDHGYTVIGYDKDSSQAETLKKDAGTENVAATSDLNEFLGALKTPKIILMLVPAGKIVDDVISELKPFLSENDLLMDCGNSHFTDTNRRSEQLQESGIHFMGVGVSGGELGARQGPSIMPGGPKKVYERVAEMLEAVSAKVNNEPCVTWLGPGSAGHYVKMVHNGIEYGLMQLIAEVYHLLKECAGMNNDELHAIFSKWNEGELQSYLIEITADIFTQKDDLTDSRIIDKILDSAKQKGTGAWTSEDAMSLQVPIPVIDIAVSMRNLSTYKKEREAAHQHLEGSITKFAGDKNDLLKRMEQALYFSIITVYAQGMQLLQVASKKYKYDLKLEDIAAIWRGGCIIRAALLEDIRSAFLKQPDLSNLMLSDAFSRKLTQSQIDIRKVIQTAAGSGIPVPAMMVALAYFDSYRSRWLPANLIQAQRDNFGAHTYERNDRDGIFHTQWNQKR
ncbi:MAG TPA: NADP-dependent phosphogluconate dehydrogenase [Bacteroidales bacterium]|nr:NADP-dependent phosphogluconate dehydrogenase [Bacteroidales bacterium]